MRLILSASFFNQDQKLFIARGTEQRRFNYPPPVQSRLSRDEGFDFLNHSFMNCRIANHACASIRFGFARFELRFEERDDTTPWPE